MDDRFSAQISETKKSMGAVAQGAADAVVNAAAKATDVVTDAAGQMKKAAASSNAGRSAASFADEAARRLTDAADYVRETEPEDLWSDFVGAVKSRPLESMAAALLLGFVAGRLARRM